jgi:hypothetical protein
MHTFQATEHPKKPTSCIDVKLLLEISTSWHPQKPGLKTCTNGNCELLHSLKGCALPSSEVLINGVCRDPVC